MLDSKAKDLCYWMFWRRSIKIGSIFNFVFVNVDGVYILNWFRLLVVSIYLFVLLLWKYVCRHFIFDFLWFGCCLWFIWIHLYKYSDLYNISAVILQNIYMIFYISFYVRVISIHFLLAFCKICIFFKILFLQLFFL